MWMRAHNDHRPDYLVERDILRRIRTLYHPVHAWDDNPTVLQLWAEEGIPTTVVPGWDAHEQAGPIPEHHNSLTPQPAKPTPAPRSTTRCRAPQTG